MSDARAASFSTALGDLALEVGPGALERLGEAAAKLGGQRVLVVSDPGIAAAGHVDRALDSLAAAGLGAGVFTEVGENPTTDHVAAGVAAARELGADLLVGLGGGSAMDCAKAVNFLVTNGGRMEDYQGFGKARLPMLPGIGVPTTAGTGSEAQSYALISQAETHQKMACGDKKARFRSVLLDPSLLATAPRPVLAATGIDALAHAVESYVSKRRNPVSDLFAREAFRRLAGHFRGLLEDPADLVAASEMLLGSFFAGAAIEASMLGAAHSCANPLTARFGLVHGHAVGLMLPAVIRFNGPVVDADYGVLLATAGERANGRGNAEALAGLVESLRAFGDLPGRLAELGIAAAAIDSLASEAAGQWTAQFNPRPVGPAELASLYEAVV